MEKLAPLLPLHVGFASHMLKKSFIKFFNTVLADAVTNLNSFLKQYSHPQFDATTIENYLSHHLQYTFDDKKKQAVKAFLSMI